MYGTDSQLLRPLEKPARGFRGRRLTIRKLATCDWDDCGDIGDSGDVSGITDVADVPDALCVPQHMSHVSRRYRCPTRALRKGVTTVSVTR
jgi:hypothetical protein